MVGDLDVAAFVVLNVAVVFGSAVVSKTIVVEAAVVDCRNLLVIG